jgi:hypothetical protein
MIELKQRQLGKSGLMGSPIGLGCWQFSGSSMAAYWNSPPQEEINEIVRVSLEGGISWFDTAEIYGFGRSLQSTAQTSPVQATCPAGDSNPRSRSVCSTEPRLPCLWVKASSP